MLESEAGKKWCPMFRVCEDKDIATNNRWSVAGEFWLHPNCIGSACACWVDEGYDDKAKERTGRCGLAR